jgi:hypothetical protein
LESCDRTSHSQIVHLILTIGGDGCDVAKHVTKVCSPSDENKSPVAAEEATFKRLLEGKDRSKKALQRAIAETVGRPDGLLIQRPNVIYFCRTSEICQKFCLRTIPMHPPATQRRRHYSKRLTTTTWPRSKPIRSSSLRNWKSSRRPKGRRRAEGTRRRWQRR